MWKSSFGEVKSFSCGYNSSYWKNCDSNPRSGWLQYLQSGLLYFGLKKKRLGWKEFCARQGRGHAETPMLCSPCGWGWREGGRGSQEPKPRRLSPVSYHVGSVIVCFLQELTAQARRKHWKDSAHHSVWLEAGEMNWRQSLKPAETWNLLDNVKWGKQQILYGLWLRIMQKKKKKKPLPTAPGSEQELYTWLLLVLQRPRNCLFLHRPETEVFNPELTNRNMTWLTAKFLMHVSLGGDQKSSQQT